MYEAVIFDFNGTLFFDTEKHIEAWKSYAEQIIGRPLKDEENAAIMGRSNQYILKYLLKRMPTDAETEKMGEEKEAVYRRLCVDDPKTFHLAPGAADFLDNLKAANISVSIATSSPLSNIDFYFDKMSIGKWFDTKSVTYDNGTIKGKPEPDIYIAAMQKLDIPPEKAVVFEDSLSGIQAAHRAGAGKIIAVASSNSREVLMSQDGVSDVISDYTEINVSAFKKLFNSK